MVSMTFYLALSASVFSNHLTYVPKLMLSFLLPSLGLDLAISRRGENPAGAVETSSPALDSLPASISNLPRTLRVNDPWQVIFSHPPLVEAKDASTPDVDLFDVDLFNIPIKTTQQLHRLGKKVICCFSAGSCEDWRRDAGEFNADDLEITCRGGRARNGSSSVVGICAHY